jgi:hypothetical protein
MSGITNGYVRIVLRAEGLALLVLELIAYAKFGLGWKTFFIFFLAPDIAFAGYLAGPRVGAVAYNLTHSSIGAVSCLLVALLLPSSICLAAGMIWLAHIDFDRALGYGLKYSQGFGFTHLGLIGREKPERPA